MLVLTAGALVLFDGGAATSSAARSATPSSTVAASPPPVASGASQPQPGWAPTTPDPIRSAGPLPAARLTAVSVRVESIGVDSVLVPLGIDQASGALVPPDSFDVAGWLTTGPVPGATGPAVIAGHVDSRAGPGVFYRLEEMVPGDVIVVGRSDGSQVSFRVSAVGQYPKTAFPTAEVYGPTPDRQLRLITCGGAFDRSRRSYLDNIVVYATQI